MRRISLWIMPFFLLAVLVSAQEIKWPVFFLRYDGGTKFEQLNEEEEESVFDYQRHKITLRIKEQWSDELTTNLYTTFFLKLYEETSDADYWYFYLNPNYIWDITDRLRWSSEFRSKWIWNINPDAKDDLDLTSLRAKTELTFKILEQLKIIPSFQGVFDLDASRQDSQQIYTAGLRLESRINPQVRLNARYRAILRAPLGEPSDVSGDDKHEFGINLSWDPNK
jgi:hypothetical protein